MISNILKFSGLSLFLLLLGLCLNRNVQIGMPYITNNGGGKEKAYATSNPELDGIQMVIFSSATSIAPEETRAGGNSQQMREFFRLLHIYLKDVVRSSGQNDAQNFIYLLSARYEKGFYLYALEKLLI